MIEYLNNSRLVHAFLEAWPVSSSWHMEHLFRVPSSVTESWHADLLPAYILLSVYMVYRKKLPSMQTIALAIAPALLVYALLKLSIIQPIILADETTHLIGAVVLLISVFFVRNDFTLGDYEFKKLMIAIGAFQSIALLVPGISRLACSFLALIVQGAPIIDVLLASFFLQAIQVSLWVLVNGYDYFQVSPEILGLEQVVFLVSVGCFVYLSRAALFLSAAYRLFWLWLLV